MELSYDEFSLNEHPYVGRAERGNNQKIVEG
jgi:hypothetical protein